MCSVSLAQAGLAEQVSMAGCIQYIDQAAELYMGAQDMQAD